MMLKKKGNGLFLIATALLVGGLTYGFLDKRSQRKRQDLIDQKLEVFSRETKEQPQVNTNLNGVNSDNQASADAAGLKALQDNLSAFGKYEFKDPTRLLEEVQKLSSQILKSQIPMEKKAALTNELQKITSQKMSKLQIPQVIGSKVDTKKNIVYPVYED